MNDRELLELAAKAAGLNVVDSDNNGLRISSDGCCTGYRWNPLTNDGDALRLAVRLNLLSSPEFRHYLSLERFGGQERDDITAHRRAIVRAAAEIGMALK